MSCKDCKFCKEVRIGNTIQKQLQCKRYPPSSHLIQQGHNVGAMSSYPAVEPTGWCGEYVEDKPILMSNK